MQAKTLIGGLLTAVLVAGCGGPEVEVEESRSIESREDALEYCDEHSIRSDYYADPGYTLWVGYKACDCYETVRTYGQVTQYALHGFSRVCN